MRHECAVSVPFGTNNNVSVPPRHLEDFELQDRTCLYVSVPGIKVIKKKEFYSVIETYP